LAWNMRFLLVADHNRPVAVFQCSVVLLTALETDVVHQLHPVPVNKRGPGRGRGRGRGRGQGASGRRGRGAARGAIGGPGRAVARGRGHPLALCDKSSESDEAKSESISNSSDANDNDDSDATDSDYKDCLQSVHLWNEFSSATPWKQDTYESCSMTQDSCGYCFQGVDILSLTKPSLTKAPIAEALARTHSTVAVIVTILVAVM
jgi:hypothetical protein